MVVEKAPAGNCPRCGAPIYTKWEYINKGTEQRSILEYTPIEIIRMCNCYMHIINQE